jgi:serine/threonine protein kinase
MKECPQCFRCWDDDAEICPDDNAPLESAFAGPAILDGKYRVDHRLGHGGMGVVYRVHHLGLQKTFALKVMATVDRAFVARFRAEAEALGQLKHPNIVDVTDFGIDSRGAGLPYLAMEYLEGTTLADRCRGLGRLPPERALPIFESIAEAINHAHERGVLHLDLKPGNVFVCDNPSGGQTVKILDFGLARFVDGRPASIEPVHDQPTANPEAVLRLGLTGRSRDGSFPTVRPGDERPTESLGRLSAERCFGTLAYMAPEVLSGQQATRASDIYSFGILIYDVLVGRPPFQGSDAEIVAGHCSGAPPPPSTLNSALPDELDAALLPALERLPARRPQKADDLVRHIRSAVSRAAVKTWRAKEIPRRIAAAVATAVVLPLALAPLSRSALLQQIENRAVDVRLLALPKRVPDPRLVLVSLDEASLTADPTPLTAKADEFGRELARVFDAGARGVAIDLLLPAAWNQSSAFSDLILKHADRLTLAAFSSPAGDIIGPECLNALTAAALGPQRALDLFGFVNLDEDADGVNRRARLHYLDRGGNERDTWARRAVRTLESPSHALSSGDARTRVALPNPAARFWIDHSADWRRFTRISWKDLSAALEREPDSFRDKLVFVGAEFVGFGGDYHRVPFGTEATEGVSGLVLQALIADTILSQFHVGEPAPSTYLLGMVVAVLVLVLAFLTSRRVLVPVLLAAGCVSAYLAVAFVLFMRMYVLVPIVGPLLTAAVATVLALMLRFASPAFPVLRTDGKWRSQLAD